MTFLPIVARELRLAARRRGTYWLRSGAALAVMVVGTWLFLIMQREPPREIARYLFWVLTIGAVLFALISGPWSTADCISEEKREGTLGLLFLTDLKGYDVVLGKLVAGSLNAFYSVVAVLPMMAIPLLLGGGITLAEFGRMALVAGDTLFFSLTLGICVSTMCRSAHKAAAITALVILLFAFALPGCGLLVTSIAKNNSRNMILMVPSAWFTYYLAFDAPYKAYKLWFWSSLGVTQGASWFCLLLASGVAPRSWQERPLGPNWLRWRERWHAWSYGDQTQRIGFRRGLLNKNPIFWLFARIRSKPAMVWGFLGLLTCGWVWAWSKFRAGWLNEATYLATAAFVNLALRYWFAGEATRGLAENRKAGALELLLSTPLKIEDILRGQWLALKRQFLGPVFAVLSVECLFMIATVRDSVPDEERVFWFALWTGGMLMLLADLAALYWVGMWRGLTARNSVRAASGGLAAVLVLPWACYALVLLMVVLVDLSPGAYRANPGWKFFLGLWFCLGLGADIAFGARARHKLRTEFRLAAQRRYDSAVGFWKRLSAGLASSPSTPSSVAALQK